MLAAVTYILAGLVIVFVKRRTRALAILKAIFRGLGPKDKKKKKKIKEGKDNKEEQSPQETNKLAWKQVFRRSRRENTQKDSTA